MELSAELREVALEAAALSGEVAVNGHTNGDIQVDETMDTAVDPTISGTTLPALAETMSSADPHGLPLDSIPDSTNPNIPAADQMATGASDPPAPPTPSKTWQAHNLDIDLISLKLSKHKYLTPSDFLADIAKIEENAEKLMDPDRITKIGEMGAHARMHVLNFDPAWEPRFEAYADRVRERKAKRAEEKKKAADAAAGVASGPVSSADEPGVQVHEDSLKRPREDGDADEGEERGDKRQKEDIVMDEPTPASITPIVDTPAPADVEQPTIPAPRPTYPPFVLPPATLSSLKSTLTHATSSFNVEQLEQLRANCFDTIWKYRAEWDRTTCLSELGRVIDGFVGEVEEMKERDSDYGV